MIRQQIGFLQAWPFYFAFDNIEKEYKIGKIYSGEIVKLWTTALCRLKSGVEGLIHQSCIDWTNRDIKPMIFSMGQQVNVKVVSIEKNKRISLSYKDTIETRDKIKDKVVEKVKLKINNITDKAILEK